jgi:hypothetical protein
MPAWLWFSLSALAGCGLAYWSYARREEPVPGRTGPAILRGLAFFLLLAGLRIPALRSEAAEPEGPLFLLDRSASMRLPSRLPGGRSRYDSALALLAPWPAGRVLAFGSEPAYASGDSLSPPNAPRTLLAPALEAASLAGFDSVVIISDGEWDDPAQAADVAGGLGLGIREERVSSAVRRIGIRDVVISRTVAAGDTARVGFELVVSGGDPAPDEPDEPMDSIQVRLRGADADLTRIFGLPASGRSVTGELSWVPGFPSTGTAEWRDYEISLEDGADPYGSADRASLLLEVVDETAGAVFISETPDWEASFLLPVLERVTSTGSAVYVRTAPGRYARVGSEPLSVEGMDVRRAVRAARLLAVQGVPDSLPAWLRDALRGHPRKLLLMTGPGGLPDMSVSVGPRLDGEWYAEAPTAPTPTSPLLDGLRPSDLPPIQDIPSLTGEWSWAALVSRRERRGEARPLAVAGRTGASRWAIVVGSGYWRWAFRGGVARRTYDGLFGGLAGWLLQGIRRRPVDLYENAVVGTPVFR